MANTEITLHVTLTSLIIFNIFMSVHHCPLPIRSVPENLIEWNQTVDIFFKYRNITESRSDLQMLKKARTVTVLLK